LKEKKKKKKRKTAETPISEHSNGQFLSIFVAMMFVL